jgi:hypothetical protein
VFADEVAGPNGYRSLAVKLRFDDLEGWTRHALLRTAAWGRLSTRSRYRLSLPSRNALGPVPAATHEEPPGEQRTAIATAMLEYGSHHHASEKGAVLEFTSDERANALLRSDPFAFLLGVLFDQNVPAERAWIAPFILKDRLGTWIHRLSLAPMRRSGAWSSKYRSSIGTCLRCLSGSCEPPSVSWTALTAMAQASGPTIRLPLNYSGASMILSGSVRRRPRWRSRSWSATSAYQCAIWTGATSPSTSTSGVFSSAPGWRSAMIETT